LVAADGGVFAYGSARFYGSAGGAHLNSPVVGITASPDGAGYWLVAADGGMFAYGNAGFYGSAGGSHLNSPVVGMAASPDGMGYRLVAADGGVFSYGDAGFYGSAGGSHLNSPTVGMSASPDGAGYRLVAADGGVFSYGDAGFYGSVGGSHLNSPIVGMSASPDGAGYWLVAADGGVFAYGSARFYGSAGGAHLNSPVVGMTASPDGAGYWLVAADGGVFSYGDAGFYGSAGGSQLNSPVVGMTATHGFAGAAGPTGPRSIVQLGDSVASGEGTLYGYTYNSSSQTWTGGNLNVTWPGPYPLCHDSPDANGQLLAAHYGAQFSQFACTGASFTNGITAPRVNAGYFSNTTLRPAEFGNWSNQTNLNPDYDAAKPDLTLVSMGADDVQFVAIVEACIENAYEYYLDLANLQCVPGNPGSTVTQDFTNYLPTLEQNVKTLAGWIEARGLADGLVPKAVFTDYYDPMPEGSTTCPDSNYLYSAQTQYLSTLLHQLDAGIIQTIQALNDPNIVVADLSKALVGHEWCTSDPWAYGLSIYSVTDPSSFQSQAPFHPTPRGQQQLADLIEPVINRLYPSS
jgi:lysophospholipase L1-like esterase